MRAGRINGPTNIRVLVLHHDVADVIVLPTFCGGINRRLEVRLYSAKRKQREYGRYPCRWRRNESEWSRVNMSLRNGDLSTYSIAYMYHKNSSNVRNQKFLYTTTSLENSSEREREMHRTSGKPERDSTNSFLL